MLGHVIQSNATFGLTDRPYVQLNHVTMPAGNSRAKTKVRPVDILSDIKRSIVLVKAASCVWLMHLLLVWPGKW